MLRTLIMGAAWLGLFWLAACSTAAREVHEEGLVAYYPLNEGSGDWVHDLSGNDGQGNRYEGTGSHKHAQSGSPFGNRKGLGKRIHSVRKGHDNL